jgi:ketosteroid isomerase-like protein
MDAFELLAMGDSGDLASAIWLEKGEVRVEGHPEPGRLLVRVTHIFWREAGNWMIIHRHGDTVVEKTEARAVLHG